MLLRREAERVHTNPVVVGDAGVVLVWLAKVEVRATASTEALVAVKLELDVLDRAVVVVLSIITRCDEALNVRWLSLAPSIVEWIDGRIILASELGGPIKGLGGVVEVQSHRERNRLGTESRGDLAASELELLNEVLVAHLREATALVSVKVEEVRVELGGIRHAINAGARVSSNLLLNKGATAANRHRTGGVSATSLAESIGGGSATENLSRRGKLDRNADLVVLEGNQGQGGTSGALGEPEVDRDVELSRSLHSVARDKVGTVVTGHELVTGLLLGTARKLVPKVGESAINLVNSLATNLNLGTLDQCMTKLRDVGGVVGALLKGDLEPESMQKITVSANDGNKLVAKAGRVRLESLLDRLARKICVSAIQVLEESNLTITGEINILHSVCDELH